MNSGWCDASLARRAALGSFRTYVGLLRYNFGAKRPNYLPTQLPSAASGRKTYLPTYLPIRRPPRKNLPTYLPTVPKVANHKRLIDRNAAMAATAARRPEAARESFAWVWTALAKESGSTRGARTERGENAPETCEREETVSVRVFSTAKLSASPLASGSRRTHRPTYLPTYLPTCPARRAAAKPTYLPTYLYRSRPT